MNSRGDYKKEKKKVTIILASVVVLFFVIGVCLMLIERNVPISSQEKEAIEKDSEGLFDDSGIDDKRTPVGSFTVAGEKYDYYDDVDAYLFFGTDDSGSDAGTKNTVSRENYKGSMADSIMVLFANHTKKTYMLLPINRDTMTEIHVLNKDGGGKATADIQLCTAHWYGGTIKESDDNTKKAVSDFLGGISFSGYYSMGMRMIGKLNHSVGGVSVTVEDDFSKVDPSLKKGATLKLSDEQALTFIHNRFDVGDEKNTSRMRRQQAYLSAFSKKAKEKIKESPAWINEVYAELKEGASTDMSAGKLSGIVSKIIGYTSVGEGSIKGKSKLGKALGDGIEHAEFYADATSIAETLKKIYL